MMKNKKILLLLLTFAMLVSVLVSCGEKKNDITYREEGLELTLPTSMRRSYSSVYEFYFSTPDSVLTAKKLDGDFMESMAMPKNTTPEEYAEAYISANSLDKSRINYKYDSESGAYRMRYNNSDGENGEDLLHFISILGEPGAVWFVEICCENSKASIYEQTFELWESTIRTYKE